MNPLNRFVQQSPWHYDPHARDCKCSYCGSIRFDGATDWVACDDIEERHPAFVVYSVCAACQSYIEGVLQEVNAAPADPAEHADTETGAIPPATDRRDEPPG